MSIFFLKSYPTKRVSLDNKGNNVAWLCLNDKGEARQHENFTWVVSCAILENNGQEVAII